MLHFNDVSVSQFISLQGTYWLCECRKNRKMALWDKGTFSSWGYGLVASPYNRVPITVKDPIEPLFCECIQSFLEWINNFVLSVDYL